MSDTKSKAEICDMLRFEQLCYSSRRPPVKNLGLAAQFLIELSHNGQFPMAFHGGWAMFLRGSSRQTEDIDVSVNATIGYVKSILLQYARVSFPLSHGATRVMIFIHTGGDWNEGVPAHPIRVHVVINGQLNTPYNIPAGTEFIAPVQIQPTPLGTDMVIVTNIFFQFQGKLDAYIKRQVTGTHSNDYNDLVFLVRRYTDDVYRYRAWFNIQHKTVFLHDYAALNPPKMVALFQRALGLEAQGAGGLRRMFKS